MKPLMSTSANASERETAIDPAGDDRGQAPLGVVTVTVNPALDQTVRVLGLTPGAVNRAESLTLNAGGKGVNVASCIADYGLPVAVTGLLGQDGAELFDALFADKGIEDRFVRVAGRPRVNVKLVDTVHGQTTDINLITAPPADVDLQSLKQAVLAMAAPGRWFVLSGSLPPGVDPRFYRALTRELKAVGARVVLDTSGAPLTASLAPYDPAFDGPRASMASDFSEASLLPDLIKPNRSELEAFAGHPLSDAAMIDAARRLIARGVRYVVISMGEHGAVGLAATADAPRGSDADYLGFRAAPLSVPVASTVGAGDAFVAGLVASVVEGRSWADCGRWATAFAAGKLERVGPHLPPRPVLEALAAKVDVETFTGRAAEEQRIAK